MKKSILYIITLFAIVVIAISNVKINSKERVFSDTCLANVEALAQELDPSKYSSLTYNCYNKYGMVTGSGVSCFKPGVSSSCTPKGC